MSVSPVTSTAVLPGDSPEPGTRAQIRASPSWPRTQSVFWGLQRRQGQAAPSATPAVVCPRRGLYGAAQRGAFPGCDLIPILGHTLQPLESQDMLPAQSCEGEDCTGRGPQGPFCAKPLPYITWGSAARSPVRGLLGVAAVPKQRDPFFPASRGSWCELNTTCLQPLFRATSPVPALGAWNWTNIEQERDGPSPTGLGGAAWLCPITSSVAFPRARDVPAEGGGCAG